MSAILFGSISTIADTSELQREAFNRAFAEHGLDWHWEREDYLELLETSGGQQRIADYAASTGDTVDAKAVHATKSALFQQLVADGSISPRPGVADTIERARRDGVKVGLVTTTSRANVASLMQALAPAVGDASFDIVVDASSVKTPKPDPAAYTFALEQLGESAGACVAVEDNLDGLGAAQAADITCVAFPNENTAGHDFAGAASVVDAVDFDALQDAADRG